MYKNRTTGLPVTQKSVRGGWGVDMDKKEHGGEEEEDKKQRRK